MSCLILNYFRGLISLQVFDTFRYLINMIFGVTASIFSTLHIFFYFSIGFAFIFTQTIKNNNFVDSLKNSFVSIFGNLPEEEDEMYDVNLWISIILLGIMMTLILSNFLIAIMSSKYSELELKHEVISLQGQADMIHVIEIIMKYFERKKNIKKVKNIKKRKWFLTIIVPKNNEKLDNNLEKRTKQLEKDNEKIILKSKLINLEVQIETIKKNCHHNNYKLRNEN